MALFNLDLYIGESINVLGENEGISENLPSQIRKFQLEINANARYAGIVDNPVPLVIN